MKKQFVVHVINTKTDHLPADSYKWTFLRMRAFKVLSCKNTIRWHHRIFESPISNFLKITTVFYHERDKLSLLEYEGPYKVGISI